MPRFQYKAQGRDQKIVKKVITASDYSEAYRLLEMNGLDPIKIVQLDKDQSAGAAKKLTLKEITIFCRQFGTMISAGIPLIRVFDILRDQSLKERKKKQHAVYEKVYQDIQSGYSLFECMEAQEGVFPPMLINMIKAGEVSGSLDSVVAKMANYYEAQNNLINRINTGLMYPKILVGMVVLIVFGLFAFILPKFFVVFEELDLELPAITKIVIGISDFIIGKWYVLIIVAVSVILAFSIAMTNERFAYNIDMLKTRFPVVKVAVEKVAIANFTSTMGVLYSSGVSMLQALEIAASVLNNRFYYDKFHQVIHEVESGKMLSVALAEVEIFEPMVTSLLFIGEESGNLEEIFEKTSDFYTAEAEEAMAKMVAVIEPVIIIFIGIVVLAVVAAVLLPSFSMASQISEQAASGEGVGGS